MLFIDRGCVVNAQDIYGRTALHFAVLLDLENVVWKLISSSDIDRSDEFGNTPLHYACRNGSQSLVDLLIISGANLRSLNRENTLEEFRNFEILNDRTQLLNYVIHESKQCLGLENLSHIS
ncbi:putative ankyrin repeat domain-containing protein 30B-like [Stegodyphus dumicola]|uniref:putative ankyrin repeat domain-containing protein 30B-like n=1 Tax=Stegodyphus dumicola TaxID=202533 RepID=UPI0015B293FF|nr:putative ankyrin repeat domain-containing protein 30B-like [Stegodyphus dumicola]